MGRAHGSRHLMFLQDGSNLVKIPAQSHILHHPHAIPQPGFLLLTVVQELGPLQGLLQRSPPEGQQGPLKGWERSSPVGSDTPP